MVDDIVPEMDFFFHAARALLARRTSPTLTTLPSDGSWAGGHSPTVYEAGPNERVQSFGHKRGKHSAVVISTLRNGRQRWIGSCKP